MQAQLRLIHPEEMRPAACGALAPAPAPAPVQISCGAGLRGQLGGALRNLFDMDPHETMPAEFEALLQAIQDRDGDAEVGSV